MDYTLAAENWLRRVKGKYIFLVWILRTDLQHQRTSQPFHGILLDQRGKNIGYKDLQITVVLPRSTDVTGSVFCECF